MTPLAYMELTLVEFKLLNEEVTRTGLHTKNDRKDFNFHFIGTQNLACTCNAQQWQKLLTLHFSATRKEP